MEQPDDPATKFALQILNRHPQISYGHAVSAAEFSGIKELPRHVFFTAVRRLGIPRSEDVAALSSPSPASLTASGGSLVDQLEGIRRSFAATAEIRQALVNMRRVVRAALAE